MNAKADISDRDYTSANVVVELENVKADLSVKASATAGSTNSLQRLSLTKGFSVPGQARMTVNPRYDIPSKTGDITVGYGNRLTAVEVNGSLTEQSVKLSQQLDSKNRIAPSFAVQSRKLAIEWERDLGSGNTLTTTLRPNESLDVNWKDGEWEANIEVPIEGKNVNGPNVSIKRDVTF